MAWKCAKSGLKPIKFCPKNSQLYCVLMIKHIFDKHNFEFELCTSYYVSI